MLASYNLLSLLQKTHKSCEKDILLKYVNKGIVSYTRDFASLVKNTEKTTDDVERIVMAFRKIEPTPKSKKILRRELLARFVQLGEIFDPTELVKLGIEKVYISEMSNWQVEEMDKYFKNILDTIEKRTKIIRAMDCVQKYLVICKR